MLHYRPPISLAGTEQQFSPFSFSSLFGVQLGKDVSNNFALSLSGLAVRTQGGRYVSKLPEKDYLVDVTPLVMPGDPGVFRIPVDSVKQDQLIVVADIPLTLLYVLNPGTVEWGEPIRGLDPMTGEIVHYQPSQNFLLDFFTVATSVFDMLSDLIGAEPAA